MKLDNEKLQQIVMEMITSLTEDEDKIVCPNCGHHNEAGVDKCSKCGHPRSKGSWKKAKAESLQEQEESYRMVKDPISGKRRMMRKSEYDDAMSQVDNEFATASGMEQDIEMRQKRGDFEQGDYGNVGPEGGEMMDHGEYPWIKSALEDLKDDEFPDKEQAIQALAKQLGMSIKIMPSDMDEEPTMSEVKTISKKKFETTLENLVFEELARVFMEQENKDGNYAGLLKKELMSQIGISDDTANRILKDKAIAMNIDTLSMAINTLSKGRKQDPKILANKAIPAVVSDAFTLFKGYKKKSPKDADGRALVNFLEMRLEKVAEIFLDKAEKLIPKPEPKVTRKLTTGDVPPHTTNYKRVGNEVIATVRTKDGLVAQGKAKIRGSEGAAQPIAYSRAQTALVQKSQERRTAGAD